MRMTTSLASLVVSMTATYGMSEASATTTQLWVSTLDSSQVLPITVCVNGSTSGNPTQSIPATAGEPIIFSALNGSGVLALGAKTLYVGPLTNAGFIGYFDVENPSTGVSGYISSGGFSEVYDMVVNANYLCCSTDQGILIFDPGTKTLVSTIPHSPSVLGLTGSTLYFGTSSVGNLNENDQIGYIPLPGLTAYAIAKSSNDPSEVSIIGAPGGIVIGANVNGPMGYVAVQGVDTGSYPYLYGILEVNIGTTTPAIVNLDVVPLSTDFSTSIPTGIVQVGNILFMSVSDSVENPAQVVTMDVNKHEMSMGVPGNGGNPLAAQEMDGIATDGTYVYVAYNDAPRSPQNGIVVIDGVTQQTMGLISLPGMTGGYGSIIARQIPQ